MERYIIDSFKAFDQHRRNPDGNGPYAYIFGSQLCWNCGSKWVAPSPSALMPWIYLHEKTQGQRVHLAASPPVCHFSPWLERQTWLWPQNGWSYSRCALWEENTRVPCYQHWQFQVPRKTEGPVRCFVWHLPPLQGASWGYYHGRLVRCRIRPR